MRVDPYLNLSRIVELVRKFELPQDPFPLALFRVLIAIFGISEIGIYYNDSLDIFGKDGWVQWEITRAASHSWFPHLEWVYDHLYQSGVTEDETVQLIFILYGFFLTLLLLGLFSRLAAFISLIIHFTLFQTSPHFINGSDNFLHLSYFYLVFFPTEGNLSIRNLFRSNSMKASWESAISIRVLQVHLCLIYLSAGANKLILNSWWNGDGMWHALSRHEFGGTTFLWTANYPVLLISLGLLVAFLEACYCICMWMPRVRVFWISAIVIMHLFIALFMQLPVFGAIMIILNICAWYNDVKVDLASNYLRRNNSIPNLV